MPVLGSGIIPSGATATELTYVTRRAFVPKLVVQIWNSSPLLAALIANAQPATGGVSSISVPVQGTQFVTPQWTDYSGSFNQPAMTQGAYISEFNLKVLAIPVPFLGMEGIVQLDHTVIPLIEARMNDATNAGIDAVSTALFNNTTNNQQLIGLPGAIDDSTNLVTYGNINRSTNVWWKSKVYAAGAVNPTRANVLQYIAGTVKNGAEIPTFGVMGIGTWTLLSQDFVANETYVVTPDSAFDSEPTGPRSAFRALMVAGIPIYADPYCPEGLLYLVNSNYLSLYIHERGSFAFTGFESTLPNFQIGYVGVVILITELVNVKPKASTRVGGYNSLTL
jgi:hypothetical protein